ncbi:unnamed protein product [Symbiodinium pilosum]|uniref:Uncharacterized protein n=1 Tax=Symbiodinium pilosum TaxID=2952 RepID=A0A812IZ97_SYMPI|nr:unnamed protein product [Symbiodinium pilosum]
MLAECLAHHGIGYLCLIMPLLETSAGATFFFSLWCLFAFCRLYDSGQQPSQSMVTQLMFNFIEGTLLRFLLISFDRTPIKKEVRSSPSENLKDQVVRTFSRPTASRFTSMQAFDRIVRQKRGKAESLEPVLAVKKIWLERKMRAHAQMFFADYARRHQQLRPNIVSHILEFVGEVVTADDSDSTSERVTLTEAALSTCTSIEWVSRQLRSFLKS